MTDPTQEPRNIKLTLALTASEKRAVQGFANVRGVTETDILRGRIDFPELIKAWEDARVKLAEVA